MTAITPSLAQVTTNFLNRVPITGLAEANQLLACAEAIQQAAGMLPAAPDPEEVAEDKPKADAKSK